MRGVRVLRSWRLSNPFFFFLFWCCKMREHGFRLPYHPLQVSRRWTSSSSSLIFLFCFWLW
jgi:hypothetical protein